MRSFRTRSAAAFAALILLVLAGLASAAQFGLSTTRIHLDAAHPVETVTMTNQEAEPLAFEVHVKRWRQDANGEWQLVPDDGLVVHPLILRIDAGKDARLRVGSLSPSVSSEVAYRIELSEVPARAQQKAGTVRMLARISVPVFVQPPNAKAAVAITVDKLDAHSAHLVLRNTGSAYAAPGDATLRVRDAAHKVVHEGKVTTNYILAGAQWPLEAKLPAGACARAATLELQYDDTAPLVATIAPGARRCAQ
jgi:fimbrial chaperone protein